MPYSTHGHEPPHEAAYEHDDAFHHYEDNDEAAYEHDDAFHHYEDNEVLGSGICDDVKPPSHD